MSIDSSAGTAILEEYSTPATIACADHDDVLEIMRIAGRNNYCEVKGSRLIDAAKNTIEITDTVGVH